MGIRRLDVTPPIGCFLAGYAARTAPSTGVYHPLTATVVSVSDSETTVLLVSIEWLGFYDRTEEARKVIGQTTGIDADHIILLGTHTHCGPAMRAVDARRHGDSSLDDGYLSDVIRRLGEAAAEAVSDAFEVTLESGRDWCGFAASRRKPDNKGGVLWEPTLDAPHDHEVPVVLARDTAGDIRLVLFSYACDPTSTGPILDIGGDYPGFAIEAVESALPGCAAMFAKGCGADQKPNFRDPDSGGFRKAEIEEVKANGVRLAESVIRAAGREPNPIAGQLAVKSELVELTTDPLDKAIVSRLSTSKVASEKMWADHFRSLNDSGGEPDRAVRVEVQSLTIGNSLALVTMAGEMSVEYGLRLKRELAAHFSTVIPLGYANAIVGYIPVDRQLPEGGYEVIANQRTLLRPGPYQVGTESRIVVAAKRSCGCV
jgi:neutral ceramidase